MNSEASIWLHCAHLEFQLARFSPDQPGLNTFLTEHFRNNRVCIRRFGATSVPNFSQIGYSIAGGNILGCVDEWCRMTGKFNLESPHSSVARISLGHVWFSLFPFIPPLNRFSTFLMRCQTVSKPFLTSHCRLQRHDGHWNKEMQKKHDSNTALSGDLEVKQT